nr:protein ACCELERATED CELL DEATH 6-like [Ipomoea batatas]
MSSHSNLLGTVFKFTHGHDAGITGVAMEFLILKHLAFTPLENIKWAFSKHLLGWKVIGKGGKIGSRGDLQEKPKEKKDDANIEKDIGFMVETSRTNITVTSLILTMTFTIGLTVPGGYNSNVGRRQGTPLLLHRFQFQAFVMYDLMAFLLSILSIFFHIVMVAEASSTKNYEVIKKYFEWNTRTTLTAALTAVAAFCSGMSATLVPLPVLDIVASPKANYIGIEPEFFRKSFPQRKLTCHLNYPIRFGNHSYDRCSLSIAFTNHRPIPEHAKDETSSQHRQEYTPILYLPQREALPFSKSHFLLPYLTAL